MSEDDDRKERLAALIRENVKPKTADSAGGISVNGSHNVFVMRGGKIVIAPSPSSKSPEAPSGKPKGKRTSWRDELEGLIWQRVWDLAMTPDQFYELAGKKLRRPVSILSKVSERDLGVLYEILAAMRRPALE